MLKDILEFVANYLNIGILIVINESQSKVPSYLTYPDNKDD